MSVTTDASGGRRDDIDSPSVGQPRDEGPAMLGSSRGRRRRERPAGRRERSPGLLRALALTAASALIPGTAHLAARRRIAGGLLLGSFLALVAAAVVAYVAVPRSRLLQLAVEPRMLRYAMIAGAVLAVVWVLVVLSSYAVSRPPDLEGPRRVVGALAVAVLAVAVTTPFALGVRTAHVQHDLISHVFGDNDAILYRPGGGALAAGEGPRILRQPRVNVLLLGSDAAEGRDGVRTDSMILASVDTSSGNTVLFSLPRNLERVRFAPGTPMARRFPYGFPDLLNAVYRYGEDHPDVVPGARYPGAELLKQAFAHTLGLDVDYFVMVNLAGFQDIVNALGGVRINVERRIPVGGQADDYGRVVVPPSRWLEPGPQVLDGYEALWYGRSRLWSEDYDRMRRQRCLIGAIARQADPIRVLTRFQKLASATKRMVLTDIPQEALPELVQLAMKGKEAKITSVTFVRSARFLPHSPDFGYVRSRVRAALHQADEPPVAATAAAGGGAGVTTTQDGAPDGTTGSAGGTTGTAGGASGSAAGSAGSAATRGPRASASPTPADPGRLEALDQVCSYA
jgi:polyisoprenyl-teichoic acid--peptidoglycan teichoic acid transferase